MSKIADLEIQINELLQRVAALEAKKKLKTINKVKQNKDIANTHIFPFTDKDEFVKMAIIEDENQDKYQVIEMMRMDFFKLANLIATSGMSSIQWSDYHITNQTAEMKNNKIVICST